MPELNGIKIGDWEFDAFINEDGHLGFTVYDPKVAKTDESPCTDIIVHKDDIDNVTIG